MLDIKFIRENKELVAAGAKKKRVEFRVDELIALDDARRALLSKIEKKRAEQNAFSERVPAMSDPAEKEALLASMRTVKEELQKEEEELKTVMKQWQSEMLRVPNIPDISVPDGKDEADNKEIFVSEKKPAFPFAPKSHLELLEGLGMLDAKRGAEVSGFRGYFLTGDGARLSFALWQFALDFFLGKGGFAPMIAPSLVRRETLLGTGYLPQGEDDLYKTQDGEYLSGTAEVAAMNYFADSMLAQSDLPKKVLAFSPCFRREAGSYGKDTKGIKRVHEFYKFEQVLLCEASHETSVRFHEEITENAKSFVEALGIPYRVVVNCGGDLGLGQVKKYDIECWMPAEGKYWETHSSSYFHDFQTRRLNIRYKDGGGKVRFAHSLNNTAAATPRLLGAVVENYQLADGSVAVPPPLQKYLGKSIIQKS